MVNTLSSAEQARVRVAAIVAAGSATLGEAFLSRILDEASSLTDDAARIRHAIARTQEYLGTARPMNVHGTPDFQLALARAGRDLAPWERLMIAAAFADTGDGNREAPANSRDYAALGGDIGSITAANYTRTHYHSLGIPWQTFSELRGEGFSGQNIMNAARDARALGFRANDREAMRDHALIDRHSIDARGMNTALQEYQRRTREDAELNALIRRRQQATTDAQRQALDAQIAASRLEHARASGLHGLLTNPAERPQAIEAGRRRRDAIDRVQEEFRELNPHLVTEEQRAALRTRLGDTTEIRRADAPAIVEDRRRTQQESEADFLAMAGGLTPTTDRRVPGGDRPPAVVVRADTPPPVTPPPTTVVEQPPPPSGPSGTG